MISWATGAGGIRPQNLQAVGGALLLPVTTAALAAAIFAVDTITDLEIEKDMPVSWCPKIQANVATDNCGPSSNPPVRNPNFHNSPMVVFGDNRPASAAPPGTGY